MKSKVPGSRVNRRLALAFFAAVVVAAGIAGYTSRCATAQEETEVSQATKDQPLRYGLRYDPMKFVEDDKTLQGALVRRDVFNRPAEGDEEIIQKRIDEILAQQLDNGSFSDSEKLDEARNATHYCLLDLLELGVPADSPEVQRTVGWAIKNPGDDTELSKHVRFLKPFILIGKTDMPEVKSNLRWCTEHSEEWLGNGCPWTPTIVLKTMWEGRALEDVDAAITEGLSWINDNLNDACCLGYWEPWSFVDTAGVIDHPLAGSILQKMVPLILRGQKSNGGWGEHSVGVFRALSKHGLLDQLKGRPPLPPDWQVKRSIPAPDGNLFSMTWDGKNLWVHDYDGHKAIAVSPEDGTVLKTLELPNESTFGIGWYDGSLVISQPGHEHAWNPNPPVPKRVLQIDPEAGEVTNEIPLKNVVMVECADSVNGKLWVGDGFMLDVCALDPSQPDKEERRLLLAGPGPREFAECDDGVWHVDFWAPSIIKSDYKGKLLDWGEKPFDGQAAGIAWDGERLWVLDNHKKRICIIEKAHNPEGAR